MGRNSQYGNVNGSTPDAELWSTGAFDGRTRDGREREAKSGGTEATCVGFLRRSVGVVVAGSTCDELTGVQSSSTGRVRWIGGSTRSAVILRGYAARKAILVLVRPRSVLANRNAVADYQRLGGNDGKVKDSVQLKYLPSANPTTQRPYLLGYRRERVQRSLDCNCHFTMCMY
jgi:hypothetical protein